MVDSDTVISLKQLIDKLFETIDKEGYGGEMIMRSTTFAYASGYVTAYLNCGYISVEECNELRNYAKGKRGKI